MNLARVGLWGTVLTLAILAASALLRLAAEVEAGAAVSRLAPAVETGARIAHRISAMGVAILAALALVMSVRNRPVPTPRVTALAAIVVLTLMLATIGRYTPGYKVAAVTVANVVGGTALACAFWWLRELAIAPSRAPSSAFRILPVLALALLLAQAGLGAAASAAAMWGEGDLGPLHLWMAFLFVVIVAAAAWRQRTRRVLGSAIVVLLALQLGLGFGLVAAGATRPLAFTLAHAVIALVLALLLVKLAAPISPGWSLQPASGGAASARRVSAPVSK